MKRLYWLLLGLALPVAASYSPFFEEPPPPEPCIFDYPYHIEGGYLSTARTNEILYAVGEVTGSYLYRFNKCTGLLFGVGYTWTRFDWQQNPYFRQTLFKEVSVVLSGFTECVRCWLWKASIGLWQQTQKINIGRYGSIDGYLWGEYDWRRNAKLHVGVIALTGKRKALVRPIIGFDWCINRRWKLNAVYPVDMSLVYSWRHNLSISGAFRFNRSRERVGPTEPIPEGIFEYRSWGTELRLTYEPLRNIRIDVFGGSTIWAWVRMRNRVDRRITYRDLDPAGYIGGYAYAVF